MHSLFKYSIETRGTAADARCVNSSLSSTPIQSVDKFTAGQTAVSFNLFGIELSRTFARSFEKSLILSFLRLPIEGVSLLLLFCPVRGEFGDSYHKNNSFHKKKRKMKEIITDSSLSFSRLDDRSRLNAANFLHFVW